MLAFQNTHTRLPERLIAATEIARTALRRHLPPHRHEALRRGGRAHQAPVQRRLGAQLGLRADDGRRDRLPRRPAQADRGARARACSPSARASRSASRPRCPTSTSRCARTARAGSSPGSSRCCGPRGGSRGCACCCSACCPSGRARASTPCSTAAIWEDGRKKGYDWAEAGWVLEDNPPMINGLARMGFDAVQDLPHLREAALTAGSAELRAAITGATGFVGSHLAAGRSPRAATRSPRSCARRARAGRAAGLGVPRRRRRPRGRARARALVEGQDVVFHVAGVVAARDRRRVPAREPRRRRARRRAPRPARASGGSSSSRRSPPPGPRGPAAPSTSDAGPAR